MFSDAVTTAVQDFFFFFLVIRGFFTLTTACKNMEIDSVK